MDIQKMLLHCGEEPKWVENVPGKGYYFCTKCRNEVLSPVDIVELEKALETLDSLPLDWGPSSILI